MSNKYLNDSGLTYLWQKVKDYILSKSSLPINSAVFYDSDEAVPEGFEELEDVNIGGGEGGSGAPIGSGMDYYGKTAPENYLFADGSAISRTEYAELFNVIGTVYGEGDGSTTFNLPDKRSRVSVMADSTGINTGSFVTLGGSGGNVSNPYTPAGTNKAIALTTSQLPKLQLRLPHVGYYNTLASTGFTETRESYSWEGSNTQIQNDGWHIVTTGGNQTHNHTFTGTAANISTLQPYLICNYIIKVK